MCCAGDVRRRGAPGASGRPVRTGRSAGCRCRSVSGRPCPSGRGLPAAGRPIPPCWPVPWESALIDCASLTIPEAVSRSSISFRVLMTLPIRWPVMSWNVQASKIPGGAGLDLFAEIAPDLCGSLKDLLGGEHDVMRGRLGGRDHRFEFLAGRGNALRGDLLRRQFLQVGMKRGDVLGDLREQKARGVLARLHRVLQASGEVRFHHRRRCGGNRLGSALAVRPTHQTRRRSSP